MSPLGALSALQEQLPLEPTGDFQFRLDVEAAGMDPDLVAALTETGPLCFLDFEATGLDPDDDDLIEAGAVLVRPGSRDAEVFNSLVRTSKELTPFIVRLTGIYQPQVRTAPPLSEVSPALDAFIGDVPVVAHNAAFERTWLERAMGKRFADHEYLDTVELLGLVYPDSRNMKLDTFCRAKLAREERHRALDDAMDTLRVVVHMLQESRAGKPGLANAVAALRHFNPASPWATRFARLPVADTATTVGIAQPTTPAPPTVHTGPVSLDRDAIAERLSDTSAGAEALEGFEPRSGQIEMMSRVFDTFHGVRGKSVALCEAGTGIGKTLAYLSVAIPFARKTGEQVIISTSGKVLQTQLLEKDIPAAAALLGYPDLRYTVMKGRGNYICHRRLDRFLATRREEPSLPGTNDPAATALIAAFANSTGHGEIDRLPTVLYQLNPKLDRFRREVTSADGIECSRQSCETAREHCVFRAARHRLEGAEVAVVNHDLLLRWPPDYPALNHLIIDEAHELVEKADGAYARSAEAVELVHRIEAVLGRRGEAPAVADDAVRELGTRALEGVARMGNESLRLARSFNAERKFQFLPDQLTVPPEGPGPSWKEVVVAALDLAETLGALARRLSDVAESDESVAAGAAEALIDAATILQSAFPYPNGDEFVFRLRGMSRQSAVSWRLVATPVSPAADFQLHVLDGATTLFGTSATLAGGSEGAGALRELELDERAASRFAVHPPIASPFDYANNLRVVFLSDTTRPTELVDRMTQATRTVAQVLGGRTLGLFTSRDRMIKVANLLDERLRDEGIDVIAAQAGNADPHELVRTFMESQRAVLLGARSFWQGVDIPGDACQAVVIEKLPFDVPGDPLLQRRAALIEAEGGSAFLDYTLPRMLLRLKQMMGRLIRTPMDRGIIVVVEPRADKRYFRRLLDVVPEGAPHILAPIGELEAIVSELAAHRS